MFKKRIVQKSPKKGKIITTKIPSKKYCIPLYSKIKKNKFVNGHKHYFNFIDNIGIWKQRGDDIYMSKDDETNYYIGNFIKEHG